MVPYFKSIGFRLLLVSVCLLILPLCIDAVIILYKHRITSTSQIDNHLSNVLLHKKPMFPKLISQTEPLFHIIESLLTNKTVSHTEEHLQEKINDLLNNTPLESIVLFEKRENQWVMTQTSSIFEEIIDPSFLDHADQSNAPIVEFHYNHLLKPYRYDAKKIATPELEGVIVLAMNLSEECERGVAEMVSDIPIDCCITYRDRVFFSSDPFIQTLSIAQFKPHQTQTLTIDNKDYLSLTDPLYADILLVAYAEKQSILIWLLTHTLSVYASYGFILCIGSAILWFMIQKLYAPLNQLGDVMHQVQHNPPKLRYRKSPLGFEINRLGAIFNEMIDERLTQEKRLLEEKLQIQRIRQKLDLASKVQQKLFPQSYPQLPGLSIYGISQSSKQIGGDFYDVYLLPNHQLMVHIADAADKGFGPCLYSLLIKNYLYALSMSGVSFTEVLNETNTLFLQDVGMTGMFVTLCSMILNVTTKEGWCINAGHPFPLIITQEHHLFLDTAQIALGCADLSYHATSFPLTIPSLICLYTDGVTEAMNSSYEQFGLERLVSFLHAHFTLPVEHIGTALLESISQFRGDAEQHDDITFVLLKLGTPS